MTDIFKKGNVLNILFNKHAQLTPSRVQAHPDVLVSFMRDVFPLENIVDEDITIVEDGICLRGAEVAKFTVTYEPVDQIKLSNLCEEMSPPPIPQDILTGQQWIELLRDLLRDGRITEARLHLDNLPPVMKDIVKVGDTHVIVPNADNVTEEMLDASRGVMLYTDVMNDHNAEHVRKMLLADVHYAKYLPEWFLKMEGHMTKADRLHLIYALTLAGYSDPEPPYVPKARAKKPDPQKFSLKIYLEGNPLFLDISREYEPRFSLKDLEGIDLKINRHQLPEQWKALFRKQAIDLSLVLKKENGQYKITDSKVRLGLKEQYVDKVRFELTDGSDGTRSA